jgi:hypothetical protein
MEQGTRNGEAEEPVRAALERVRAGVRQRRSELASLGERREGLELVLLELKAREFTGEPVPVSPRRFLGRLLVFARRGFFHLFFKWYARPLREQQNAFNQAASRLLQDLVRQQGDLGRHLERLERRLSALEATARPAEPEQPAPDEP